MVYLIFGFRIWLSLVILALWAPGQSAGRESFFDGEEGAECAPMTASLYFRAPPTAPVVLANKGKKRAPQEVEEYAVNIDEVPLQKKSAAQEKAHRITAEIEGQIDEIEAALKAEGQPQLTLREWREKLKAKGVPEDALKDRNFNKALWKHLNRKDLLASSGMIQRITEEIEGHLDEIKAALEAEGQPQLTISEWREKLKAKGVPQATLKDEHFNHALTTYLNRKDLLASKKNIQRITAEIEGQIDEIEAALKAEGQPQLTIIEWREKLQEKGVPEDALKDRNFNNALRHYLNTRNLLDSKQHVQRMTEEIEGRLDEIEAALKAEGQTQLMISEWNAKLQEKGVPEDALRDENFNQALRYYLKKRKLLALNKNVQILAPEIEDLIGQMKAALEDESTNRLLSSVVVDSDTPFGPKVREEIDAIVHNFPSGYMESLSIEEWIENLKDEKIITRKQAKNERFVADLEQFLKDKHYL